MATWVANGCTQNVMRHEIDISAHFRANLTLRETTHEESGNTMIEEVVAFKVTCDGCNAEYPLYEDKIAAQTSARLSGWVIEYGAQMRLAHVYCPTCWRKVRR